MALPKVTLVKFGPEAVSAPALVSGGPKTYALYQIENMAEAEVHPFTRLVPAVATAFSGSKLPLDKVDVVADIMRVVVSVLEDGKIDAKDIARVIAELTD